MIILAAVCFLDVNEFYLSVKAVKAFYLLLLNCCFCDKSRALRVAVVNHVITVVVDTLTVVIIKLNTNKVCYQDFPIGTQAILNFMIRIHKLLCYLRVTAKKFSATSK